MQKWIKIVIEDGWIAFWILQAYQIPKYQFRWKFRNLLQKMLLILVWSHANSYKTTEAAAAAAENDVDSCDHPEGKPVQCFVTVIIRVGIGIEVSLGAIDPHVACNIQIDWLINDRLYSGILHSLEQTHCACMWFYMNILAFYSAFF